MYNTLNFLLFCLTSIPSRETSSIRHSHYLLKVTCLEQIINVQLPPSLILQKCQDESTG